jgi:DNA-binding NtrC family response regulator
MRQVEEGHFDIAIIDLDLPPVNGVTMGGWELASIFRVHHPAISLILIGTEDAEAAGTAAERMRASQFLEKPISPARLKTIVGALDP